MEIKEHYYVRFRTPLISTLSQTKPSPRHHMLCLQDLT